MSFKRYCKRPYSTVQPYRTETSSGGGGFGESGETTFHDDGPPVPVKPRVLSDEETTRAGIDVAVQVTRMWTDTGYEHIRTGKRVYYPAGTDNKFEIINTVPYEGRHVVQFEVKEVQ